MKVKFNDDNQAVVWYKDGQLIDYYSKLFNTREVDAVKAYVDGLPVDCEITTTSDGIVGITFYKIFVSFKTKADEAYFKLLTPGEIEICHI
jgi:hypothetical protein